MKAVILVGGLGMRISEKSHRKPKLIEHPELDGVAHVCSGRPVSVQGLVEQQLHRSGASLQLILGAAPYAKHKPMAFWGDNNRLATLWHGTQ